MAIRSTEHQDDVPLECEDVTEVRSVCLRLSFWAVEFAHFLHVTKEALAKMQSPMKCLR